MSSPSMAPPPTELGTPERARQFMPMSSPAPFYRYSSITTPGTVQGERSSPPSSGAIDLAETLVEFSSPVKPREAFIRRGDEEKHEVLDESPVPVTRNGVKSSLGDLQGVDLLRGFEKISSSWREEGSSPVKEEKGGSSWEESPEKRREAGSPVRRPQTPVEKKRTSVLEQHTPVRETHERQEKTEMVAESEKLVLTSLEGLDSQMTEVRTTA
jgi:hypothetical protein